MQYRYLIRESGTPLLDSLFVGALGRTPKNNPQDACRGVGPNAQKHVTDVWFIHTEFPAPQDALYGPWA